MSGKLQELSRCSISYSKLVAFRAAWNGTTLCVLTDLSLELFDLSCDLNSYSKSVEVLSSSLPCPPRPRSESVDLPLWGLTQRSLEQLSIITTFAWSPFDDVINYGSVLAILTSYGVVSFYTRRGIGWTVLLDLSALLYESKQWKKSKDTNIIRERNSETHSSSICWGSLIKQNSCFFLTAQKNGMILFWEIVYKEDEKALHAVVIQEFETDLGEIKTMTWISKAQGQFALICSAMNGVIKIYDCRIKGNSVVVGDSSLLWQYRDLMVLNHIIWFKRESNVVFVCAKNRHLLVFLISPNNEVLSQYIDNVNDFTITAMTKTINNNLYIASTNGIIYEVIISTESEPIKVDLIKVNIKDDYSEYTMHDMTVSGNNALWVLTLVRKPIPRRYKPAITIVFLKLDNFNSIDVLLENPSQTLTHMWDCIEILRCECARDKHLPIIDHNIFTDPNLSTYHMKLYLVLSKLHQNYEMCNSGKVTILDSLSPDIIRDTLLVRQAVSLVDGLHQSHQEIGQLSPFQRQVLLGCCHYIETYCKKYRNDLSSYVNSEAMSLAKSEDPEFSYRCSNCGEHLVEFKCSCGHPNQFCSVSLQPILRADYLLCRLCGGTACVESYLEKPMCIFCDVFLEKFSHN